LSKAFSYKMSLISLPTPLFHKMHLIDFSSSITKLLYLVELWCLVILSTLILLLFWVLAHLNTSSQSRNLFILSLYIIFTLAYLFRTIILGVLGKDINILLEKFAHLLHLSCEGVDITILIYMILTILTVSLPSLPPCYFMMMITPLWLGMRRWSITLSPPKY